MPTALQPHVEATMKVCQRFALSEAGHRLLESEPLAPNPFFIRLRSEELLIDAVRFAAHSMPKRDVVWWAAQCVRLAMPHEKSELALKALAAAERWAANPTDAHRRAALTAAQAADVGTPAGSAAMAAFFSGGSLAPPDLPTVVPADHLTGQMAAAAVVLAAVSQGPAKANDFFSQFCDLALEVALQANRWKEEG